MRWRDSIYGALDMTHLPAAERPLPRALRGETFADAEMLLVLAEGDIRRVSASGTCRRVDGAMQLAIVVFHDTTERQRLETHLAQTVRLAAIGTLAAGVAHEINNPLTYVRSNIELVADRLRAQAADPGAGALGGLDAMLEDALTGAHRIAKIVSSLRTFAKEPAEQRVTLDLRGALDRAIALTVNELRHRARLSRSYGPVPSVEVDEARLGQVFVNLLIHAAHRLPEENASRNEIEVTTSTSAGGGAVVTIRDNGPAIAAEVLPLVFDPFFMTNAADLGLGLSVCRNLVLAMGGEIEVESRQPNGATFRIQLPPARKANEESLAAVSDTLTRARRAAVLVVDDEASIGVVVQRILHDDDVTFVTSVDEAVALLRSGQTFDVIFSDLMMPDRSGIDLYDELTRSWPEHVERMVIVTGGTFTRAGSEFLERVPNERIQKPFSSQAIRAAVRRLAKAGP